MRQIVERWASSQVDQPQLLDELDSIQLWKVIGPRHLFQRFRTSLCSASLQFADPCLIIATNSFRFHSGLSLKAQEYPSCREIAIWEACVYTKLRNCGYRRCSPMKFSPCTLRCHNFANISKYPIQRRRQDMRIYVGVSCLRIDANPAQIFYRCNLKMITSLSKSQFVTKEVLLGLYRRDRLCCKYDSREEAYRCPCYKVRVGECAKISYHCSRYRQKRSIRPLKGSLLHSYLS